MLRCSHEHSHLLVDTIICMRENSSLMSPLILFWGLSCHQQHNKNKSAHNLIGIYGSQKGHSVTDDMCTSPDPLPCRPMKNVCTGILHKHCVVCITIEGLRSNPQILNSPPPSKLENTLNICFSNC